MARIVSGSEWLMPIEALGESGLPGVSWWRKYREAECMAFPGSVRVLVRIMEDTGTGTHWFGLFTVDGDTGEVLKLRAMHQTAGGCGPFDPDTVRRMMESLTEMVSDDETEFYA